MRRERGLPDHRPSRLPALEFGRRDGSRQNEQGCEAITHVRLTLAYFVLRRYVAVIRVDKPPRGLKSPITVACSGWAAFTTSARKRLTTFSWKIPRFRYASVYIFNDFSSKHLFSGV